MDVPKLLKKAQRQCLTLKLYCLYGRTVKHKAIGNLERLLHQGNYEELVLDVHYPGCPFEAQTKTGQAAGSDALHYDDIHKQLHVPRGNRSDGIVVDVGQNRLNAAAKFNQQRAAARKEEGLPHNAVDVANADGLVDHTGGVGMNEGLDHHNPGHNTRQATLPCSQPRKVKIATRDDAFHEDFLEAENDNDDDKADDDDDDDDDDDEGEENDKDDEDKDEDDDDHDGEAEWHAWKAKKDALSRGDSFFKGLLETVLGTWLGLSSLETQMFIIIASFLSMIGCMWNCLVERNQGG